MSAWGKSTVNRARGKGQKVSKENGSTFLDRRPASPGWHALGCVQFRLLAAYHSNSAFFCVLLNPLFLKCTCNYITIIPAKTQVNRPPLCSLPAADPSTGLRAFVPAQAEGLSQTAQGTARPHKAKRDGPSRCCRAGSGRLGSPTSAISSVSISSKRKNLVKRKLENS